MNQSYTLGDFLPLSIIIGVVIVMTVIIQIISANPWEVSFLMRYFMASFFIIFGTFKIINLAGFSEAYAMYDLIAARFSWYGYVYPFIELALGIAYLIDFYPLYTNMLTLILMTISAIGVFYALKEGKHLMCACLGTLFKIPMTYVTLAEDLVMAIMAVFMLLYYI
jgi:hypothetical protein